MACPSVTDCVCPKKTCANNGKCCACVVKHRETDSLPFCLFLDNGGDKSLKNFYHALQARFEKLGAIPLEDTDLTVNPARQELTGAHGDEVVCLVK